MEKLFVNVYYKVKYLYTEIKAINIFSNEHVSNRFKIIILPQRTVGLLYFISIVIPNLL